MKFAVKFSLPILHRDCRAQTQITAPFAGLNSQPKMEKQEMKEGTKVVMTEQMIGMTFNDEFPAGVDTYDLEPREGMLFVYRGKNSVGCHEFAPDYDQGHNIGFQLPDEDYESEIFRNQFRPVAEWLDEES